MMLVCEMMNDVQFVVRDQPDVLRVIGIVLVGGRPFGRNSGGGEGHFLTESSRAWFPERTPRAGPRVTGPDSFYHIRQPRANMRRPSAFRLGVAGSSGLLVLASVVAARRQQPATRAVESTTGMVVSYHEIASDIGARTLARGGNAVDAAVA